jgi:small subunit ribosomal protein S6
MSLRRVYESTIIVNAALEDPDIDVLIQKVTGYIENHGGKIQEVNKWGRRRLAYPINKKFNGFYVHIVFDTMPNTVPIFERFLVLEDTILRHLTLQLPDKLRDYRRQRELEKGKATEEKKEGEENKPAETKS